MAVKNICTAGVELQEGLLTLSDEAFFKCRELEYAREYGIGLKYTSE